MKKATSMTALAVVISMMIAFNAVAAPKTNAGSDKQIGNVERASKLLGKEIKNANGDNIGKLDNLVVDLESGRLLYGVVGLNGGNRVAIPPGKLTYSGDKLVTNAKKENIQNAPKFDKDQVTSTSFASEVYQHFNQPIWWAGGDSSQSKGTFGNPHRATELIGKEVKSSSNSDYGKIKDLVVDVYGGRVLYVAFAPSGDSGKANQVYLMPPNAFTMSSDDKSLVTGVERSKLEDAPHFTSGNWPSNLEDTSYANKIYDYYGKDAYFK